MDCEVLDPVCELCGDEAFFTEGTSLVNTLTFCLQEFHLLHDIGKVLIILAVAVDIGEEAPVIEVIDGILKDGILGTIAPEAMTDPGGEGLNQLVRGIIWGGIQLNDLCLFLAFCS